MALVKDLIKRLSDLSPDEPIWYSYSTKDETEDYFVEGCKISDEDFEKFANNFSGDFEYFSETLNDTIDAKFYCSECCLYDYQAKEVEGEILCSKCGEENDLLTQ